MVAWVLEGAGVACLATCVGFVWPPAALAVVGIALLIAGFTNERTA